MLQLTQKGKEVYEDLGIKKTEIKICSFSNRTMFAIEGGCILAHNWLELKALIDLGLVEIK